MEGARVAYLGPEGTFSHQAALNVDGRDTELRAMRSIAEVLESVTSGEVTAGVVPLENAIEGTVSATVDALVFNHDLLIVEEIVVPVSLHLMARVGLSLSEVTDVWSYTHALAQCRKILKDHPQWVVHDVESTAEAARLIASSLEPGAAIASRTAADHFGLVILAEDVEDHPDNETRFVVVSSGPIPAPTGHDRTSIVCFQDADRPGSLYGILGRFAARDINLTRLESRPTKRALGDYCFIIELEGHLADDVVADCLADLQAHLARVKFLGSYPITGTAAAEVRVSVTAARASADVWMRDLRARIDR
jgi:prephenate dehydratase